MMDGHEHEQDIENEQEEILDLNEVMQRFGVSEWNNLGFVETPGADQLSLLVDIQGQRYVLKERPESPLGADISERYQFRSYLQSAGIPIPSLWMTPQGEPAVEMGEDFFELEQWVDGELFNTSDPRNLDCVASSGAMLARLHQASRRYNGSVHRWPSEAHMGGLVQGYLNLARAQAEASEIQAIAAALSDWVEQWEAILPAAMMSIGSVRGLPELHIHGDYRPTNLRFGLQGVNAVLSLEASHWEKRIFEVAYGLFCFSALDWQPENRLTRPLVKRGLDPERASLFLQAYSAIYPPARDEASALADALTLLAPILTINGPLEDIFFAQEGSDEALIDDVLERLAWATSLPSWLQRVRRQLAEMWG
jgi:Ser/Thr protein kinase RdoA (MazF antagonist)